MDTLGTDLVLLSIDPGSGRIRLESNLRYGLMGSELVRLAAKGRIDIRDDRIIVLEPADVSTGDPQLDEALGSIMAARRALRPRVWVGRPRPGIVQSYLDMLAAWGVIGLDGRGMFARRRIIDQPAAASARARLDAIAFGTGQVDLAQASYAGLAHAVRLDRALYPGWDMSTVHRRFQEIARGQWTAAAVQSAISSANAASMAAMNAAAQAATNAATQAAITAATNAAIQASMAATSPPMS
jgi:hypothetical protein